MSAPFRVLVIDDDQDTAESTATLLTLHGFHATCAFDCDGALRAAADDPPDVALIDLAMPLADGCEVARRLLGLGQARAPLLIAVTGMASNWDQEQASSAGFHLYLIKPVPPADLISILWQCRESRRETTQ